MVPSLLVERRSLPSSNVVDLRRSLPESRGLVQLQVQCSFVHASIDASIDACIDGIHTCIDAGTSTLAPPPVAVDPTSGGPSSPHARQQYATERDVTPAPPRRIFARWQAEPAACCATKGCFPTACPPKAPDSERPHEQDDKRTDGVREAPAKPGPDPEQPKPRPGEAGPPTEQTRRSRGPTRRSRNARPGAAGRAAPAKPAARR